VCTLDNDMASDKERYRTDEKYREAIKRNRRERYRQDKAKSLRTISTKDVHKHAQQRVLKVDHPLGGGGCVAWEVPCLSTKEMGQVLGYDHTTMSRWQREGLFPKPIYEKASGPGRMYSVAQAHRIVQVMQHHHKTHQYLYTKDTHTIEQLQKAFNEGTEEDKTKTS